MILKSAAEYWIVQELPSGDCVYTLKPEHGGANGCSMYTENERIYMAGDCSLDAFAEVLDIERKRAGRAAPTPEHPPTAYNL